MFSTIRSSRRIIKQGMSTVNNSFDLMKVYATQIEVGNLRHDDRQARLVKLLNKLNVYMRDYAPPPRAPPLPLPPRPATPSSATKSATDGIPSPEENLAVLTPSAAPRRLKGIYIYGHVGVGKSMIMDLFYNHCPISAKRRVHFHKFMLEIHQRIHLYKKKLLSEHGRDIHINLSSERDAITIVAHDIADECRLLCFDEFQVTDICDAMILTKFFGVLWERGTVLVATSNRPPGELYNDGLNRQYFLPFIERIRQECVVFDMEAIHDYRQENVRRENAYYTPVNEATTKLLWDDFLSSSGGEDSGRGRPRVEEVSVMMGRTVSVTVCGDDSGSSESRESRETSGSSGESSWAGSGHISRHRACWVDFKYLCEGDRFASDYKAICEHFDEFFLCGVPQLSVVYHDRARRFITLIDEAYDAGVRLHFTAENAPDELFRELSSAEMAEAGFAARLGTGHGWKGGIHVVDSIGVVVPPMRIRSPVATSHNEINGVNEAYRSGVDAAEDQLRVLEGELSSVQELRFAFQRAASRLVEMTGQQYYQKWISKRLRQHDYRDTEQDAK